MPIENLINSLKKNFICTEEWGNNELFEIIALAKKMKIDPYSELWGNALKNKNFLMIFYNPSLRTHLSFETAVTELGGHAIYRNQAMGWTKTKNSISSSESLKDIAKVVSRYVDGVGIRISMDAIHSHGLGHNFILEFAKYADVPVINMADDRFHPCQGLADIMTWAEWYSVKNSEINLNDLNGKTLLLTWGSSGFARPFASVQSHLLLAARFGMNINLAYPKGYDLDKDIIEKAKQYCNDYSRQFNIIHDPDSGYQGSDVVYVRNWVSNEAYKNNQFQYQSEISQALNLSDWIVTKNRMSRTNEAIFSNPMPIDRGREAEDGVIDSKNSVMYDVAENRLHSQKAVLALLMG